MKFTRTIAVAAALMLTPAMAQANSIGAVEGARAKERQGAYLTGQDVEQLRRYGGNDDYGYSYGPYTYGDAYYGDSYVDDYDYGPVVEFGYEAY
jgi:hypothetical protein